MWNFSRHWLRITNEAWKKLENKVRRPPHSALQEIKEGHFELLIDAGMAERYY